MFLFKTLIALSISSSILSDDGWVSVPRPQRVPYQLEEEDRSIWVVFSKTFGSDRVLIRFPIDPSYQWKEGHFVAAASYHGQGEFSVIVRKKSELKGRSGSSRDIVYKDAENDGSWVRERHVESEEYFYVLRYSSPFDSPSLFGQFADSFEIENRSK